MTKINELYHCEICGNLVEIVHIGAPVLVCCEKPMTLIIEKNADFKTEKHVPLIEKTDSGIKVTVGSTLHPMTEEHHIEWIELIADGLSFRKYLKVGELPVAEFCCNKGCDITKLTARESCNIHGLWKNL